MTVGRNAESLMRGLSRPPDTAAIGSFNGVRWPGREDLFLAVDKANRFWVLIGPTGFDDTASDAFVGAAVSVGCRRDLSIRIGHVEERGAFITLSLMHDSLHLLPEFGYLTEVLAEVLPSGCTLSDVLAVVVRFGVLFVDGEEASVESTVGLWGELWTIHSSVDPGRWIEAWHQSTSSLLDFELENCAVEVKTTLNEAALHHFRQRQVETRLHDGWLLSIRIYASASGLSIGDLLDAIAVRVDSVSRAVVIDKSMRVMRGDLRALRGWKFELQAEGVAALAMIDVPRILGEQSPALRSIAFEIDLNEVLVTRRHSFEELDERMVRDWRTSTD